MAEDFVARYRLEGKPCRFDMADIDLSRRPSVGFILGAF
jgi:hypothetical protein